MKALIGRLALQVAKVAGYQVSSRTLEILPGTEYARYAIPVEYLPSRDLTQRWGNKHPPIEALRSWFADHAGDYKNFLEKMRANAPFLADIPMLFSEDALPSPAWSGVPYAPFDSLALYTMIRDVRPKIYMEIGSGATTCFAYKAIRDGDLPTRIISIDPEPRAKIDAICDEIIREGIENYALELFDQLSSGDILFFDGSHRSFMNSDVTVFFIDILPRLKPGVIVHIHDISLPWDYDNSFRSWYWNEQYLLAVYLMGNMRRINPLLPTAFINRSAAFADYFDTPFVDLASHNDGWKGGGAMWFTHKGG